MSDGIRSTTPSRIITAAGDSTPLFIGAGFGRPKNLVRVNEIPVLQRALSSYAPLASEAVVVLNHDECLGWKTNEILEAASPGLNTIQVPTSVQGALVSALYALGSVSSSGPLIVAAGDSEILGGIEDLFRDFLRSNDAAGTIVFRGTEDRWSFVEMDASGYARQVYEKEPVGDVATTGVFMFRQGTMFAEAASWCLVNNAQLGGNFYVSQALNYLISAGERVGTHFIPRERYQPWSLPADFAKREVAFEGRPY